MSAQLSECLSARIPKCPLSAWVSKCLSAQVPWVPEKCTSTQVSWVLKCPSALGAAAPTCPSSALSARVLKYPLNPLSARVPESLECLECPSTSVSQLVSQPAGQLGLQCWFSKLISTLMAHTLSFYESISWTIESIFFYLFEAFLQILLKSVSMSWEPFPVK